MSSVVTLDEAKAFLRFSSDTSNTLIQTLIDGAEDWAARFLGCNFTATEHIDYLDGGLSILRPHWSPLAEVTEVADGLDDYTPLDPAADDYYIVGNEIRYGAPADAPVDWPAGSRRWRVTYTAGWTAETIPAGLKNALLQMVHRSWSARGGISSQAVLGSQQGWERFDSLAGEISQLLIPYRQRTMF